MTYAPASTFGNTFIPTHRDFFVDEEQLKLLISTVYTQIATNLNIKINGAYDVVEVQTGQQFNDPNNAQQKRFAFRKIFYINPAALTFNHGITGITQVTALYGCYNSGANFYPIPLVSTVAVANQVSISANATQIIITNGGGAPAINSGIIILEYLKN